MANAIAQQLEYARKKNFEALCSSYAHSLAEVISIYLRSLMEDCNLDNMMFSLPCLTGLVHTRLNPNQVIPLSTSLTHAVKLYQKTVSSILSQAPDLAPDLPDAVSCELPFDLCDLMLDDILREEMLKHTAASGISRGLASVGKAFLTVLGSLTYALFDPETDPDPLVVAEEAGEITDVCHQGFDETHFIISKHFDGRFSGKFIQKFLRAYPEDAIIQKVSDRIYSKLFTDPGLNKTYNQLTEPIFQNALSA